MKNVFKEYNVCAIHKNKKLPLERKHNMLVKAILNRFCPCKAIARDTIEIHLKHQDDMSRLAGRL